MYVRNLIWVSCSFGFTIWLHLQVVKCDVGDMFDEAGNVPTPAPDSELQPAPAPVYRPKAEPESKSDPELAAVHQCKEPRAGVEPENKRKMTIYLSCSNMQSFNTFC